MGKKSPIDMVAFVLVIIGALNWGLIGIADLNIVQMILGSIPILLKIVYILVGLGGLWGIYMHVRK